MNETAAGGGGAAAPYQSRSGSLLRRFAPRKDGPSIASKLLNPERPEEMQLRHTTGSALTQGRSCDPSAALWPSDEEGDELGHREWGATTLPDTSPERGAEMGEEDPSEAHAEARHGELQPLIQDAQDGDAAVAFDARQKTITYRAAPTGGDSGARKNRERVRADVLGAWHRRELLGLAVAAGWVSVAERQQSLTRRAIRSRPGVRGLAGPDFSKAPHVAVQLAKSGPEAAGPSHAVAHPTHSLSASEFPALPASLDTPDSSATPATPAAAAPTPAKPAASASRTSVDGVRVIGTTWTESAVVTAAAAQMGGAAVRKGQSEPNVGAGVAAGLGSLVLPLVVMSVPLSAGAIALAAASSAVAGATCPGPAIGMAAWGVAYGVVGLVLAIARSVWLGQATATGSLESLRALGAVSLGSHVVRACLSMWGLVVAVGTAALLAIAPFMGLVGSAGLARCGGAWPLAVLVVCATVFGAAHVAAAVAAVAEAVAGPSVREDSETKLVLAKLETTLQGGQPSEAHSTAPDEPVGSCGSNSTGPVGASAAAQGTMSKRTAGGFAPARDEMIP